MVDDCCIDQLSKDVLNKTRGSNTHNFTMKWKEDEKKDEKMKMKRNSPLNDVYQWKIKSSIIIDVRFYHLERVLNMEGAGVIFDLNRKKIK